MRAKNMTKETISPDNVYRAASPYVQAITVTTGKVVYTSGVLGRNTTGQLVHKSDAAAQTRQCIENIRLLIEAAGGTLHDLVKLTVFVTHPKHYDAMNTVRKEMLGDVVFTSTTVVAQLIDPHGIVEMDAVAVVGER